MNIIELIDTCELCGKLAEFKRICNDCILKFEGE